MAEPFVEFGCEGVKYFIENYWDRGYDSIKRKLSQSAVISRPSENTAPASSSASHKRRRHSKNSPRPAPGCADRQQSAHSTSGLRGGGQSVTSDQQNRHLSLDRQTTSSRRSALSQRTNLQDLPPHLFNPPLSSHNNSNLKTKQETDVMSYANGGLSAGGSQQQRANSAQPPRSRYYDDDEEYGSDYDDRRGGRGYNDTSRGYDNQYYDDRGYGREVIETERYKGPARDFDNRRQSFRSNDPNAGAMTQYNRQNDDYYQSRRSRSRGSRASRGRRDSRSRSRSRSYSRSRSGSRDRGHGERGFQQKIGEHFDTSLQGIGVGLAGAVVGGMAGRHFGERDPRHKNRDILIGALVGGLGANAAETKWRGWMDEKKEKVRDDEERWEQRYDGRDYGRSRSSMR